MRCEAIVKEIYPPILEKVERLIEGSSLEATDFKTYFYTRSGPPQIGCTGFTILPPYAKDGWLLFGGQLRLVLFVWRKVCELIEGCQRS